ncbi:unnamed protein product [Eretmochelys imbricata]
MAMTILSENGCFLTAIKICIVRRTQSVWKMTLDATSAPYIPANFRGFTRDMGKLTVDKVVQNGQNKQTWKIGSILIFVMVIFMLSEIYLLFTIYLQEGSF